MNQFTFNHSLICNTHTISRFLKCFKLSPDQYKSEDNEQPITNLEKAVEDVLNRYHDNIDTMRVEFKQQPFICGADQHAVGDLVTVSYSPLSQRYTEYYDEQTFKGYIFFVDNENDTMFLFNILSDGIATHSLERDGCHYMGMSRGYTHYIHKET